MLLAFVPFAVMAVALIASNTMMPLREVLPFPEQGADQDNPMMALPFLLVRII
ncbi:hypothetical protein [Thioalkalivibrio sp. AKL19]|uniref:hypothetical protein n=1 Tax=Thioalkalivibrio sp. AKL19 TaxID=1266914 RepID=UPI0004071D1E|nr:hypothetical protein [Thioalkalivibrio sp. AKL19]